MGRYFWMVDKNKTNIVSCFTPFFYFISVDTSKIINCWKCRALKIKSIAQYYLLNLSTVSFIFLIHEIDNPKTYFLYTGSWFLYVNLEHRLINKFRQLSMNMITFLRSSITITLYVWNRFKFCNLQTISLTQPRIFDDSFRNFVTTLIFHNDSFPN